MCLRLFWLAHLSVSDFYHFWLVCLLENRKVYEIPSVSGTSWSFWIIYFLHLNCFPSGWNVSSSFATPCALRDFLIWWNVLLLFRISSTLIISIHPKWRFLYPRKLVDNMWVLWHRDIGTCVFKIQRLIFDDQLVPAYRMSYHPYTVWGLILQCLFHKAKGWLTWKYLRVELLSPKWPLLPNNFTNFPFLFCLQRVTYVVDCEMDMLVCLWHFILHFKISLIDVKEGHRLRVSTFLWIPWSTKEHKDIIS